MLKINIVLVLCVVGLCTAATTPKPKNTTPKSDISKGKRDAAIEGTPYSYEQPQKSYQVYIQQQQQQQQPQQHQQQQQKAAPVEYHQAPQKVAPLNHYEKLQAASLQAASHQSGQGHQMSSHIAPIHVQPQEQQYEQAQQYQAPAGYSTGIESLFANSPYKSNYEYSYIPSYEFEKMQTVHYPQDINNPFLGFSDFKEPQYASYKSSSPYQQAYTFESPVAAHNFQSQSFIIPQQNEHLHQAYLAEYAAQGPSSQSAHYYGGFSQQPSALFLPQTVAIPAKPTKIPDYASGVKGLGHFSTVSSNSAPAPTQQATYHKQQQQTYEVPSYVQYTHSQTERPFKASAFLGSQQHGYDSHSEQSISNAKPAGQYLLPSKAYLPAKEQQQYVAPAKTYLPAKEQQHYVQQQHYVPAKEQYAPSKNYHYVPEQSPVEYQIEYIQAPAKNYLPASSVANNYLPPKAQQPKGTYLPPKKTYLTASQPTSSYLPPSNPYQSSYHAGTSHQAPAQQHQQQQYQHQDSYESLEYQSAAPQSGHK